MNKKFFSIALIVALSLTLPSAISAPENEDVDITIKSGNDWHKRQTYTQEEYDKMLEKARQEEQIMLEKQGENQKNEKKKQSSYWDF